MISNQNQNGVEQSGNNVINWTPENVKILREAFNVATERGVDSFVVRIDGVDHEIVTRYADFLLQELDRMTGVTRDASAT